jgi:hypothetical protein
VTEQIKETSKGSVEDLYQVAEAAGHGDGLIGREYSAGWVDVEFAGYNTRPSYDRNFIETFSPEFVQELLTELKAARAELAEYKDAEEAANYAEHRH